MSKWIRKGDKVVIIAGNDKGKVGEVLSKTKAKILVEGVNIRTIHQKPKGQNEPGKIVKMEKPIAKSNVMIAVDEKPVKLKSRINDSGEKELYYISNKKEHIYRLASKPAKV